jgi:hypothetical protein
VTNTISITDADAVNGRAPARLFAVNGWKVGAVNRDGRFDLFHAALPYLRDTLGARPIDMSSAFDEAPLAIKMTMTRQNTAGYAIWE